MRTDFDQAICGLIDKNGLRILPVIEDMRRRDEALLIINLASDDANTRINAYVAEKFDELTAEGIVSLAKTGNCREILIYNGDTNADSILKTVQARSEIYTAMVAGPSSPVLRDETALFHAIDNGIVRVYRAEQDYKGNFPSFGYHGRPTLAIDGETAYQAGRLYRDPDAVMTKLVSIARTSSASGIQNSGSMETETIIKEIAVGAYFADLMNESGFEGFALIGGICGRLISRKALEETRIGFCYECDSVRLFTKSDCVVDALNDMYIAAKELSCAKCVMCREGSWQISAIFSDITRGRSNRDDIVLLEDICPIINAGALCLFGKNMIRPALNAVAECREILEKHVIGRSCPAGKCAGLMKYIIDPTVCDGCGECQEICPEEAIEGKDGFIHVIDEKLCDKCGDCVKACPVQAIKQDAGAIRTPRKPVKAGRFN